MAKGNVLFGLFDASEALSNEKIRQNKNNEVPSASQIKKDARALYGALLSACQSGVGRRILMENRDKQDGICPFFCPKIPNLTTETL
jgi:hypothetical protein